MNSETGRVDTVDSKVLSIAEQAMRQACYDFRVTYNVQGGNCTVVDLPKEGITGNDEYYGSQKARDAYLNLHAAYEKAGLTDSEIDRLLQLNIPDNAYFNAKGIYNYHGGGSIVLDDENVLNRVIAHSKG